MTKAAVVIGVNKTGDLPVLRDAAAGAGRVAEWLTSEGYHTQVLLDEKTPGTRTPVRAHDIFSAVEASLEPGTCEQLVIYFSGHGYLNDGSEHWLLSDAPANPNEAISVEENIQLARDCGVPNVIFVSDACRSTPQSIKADRVRGTLIFPNTGVSATARADVDRFFACLPGDPAYEVAVDKSSGVYSALFTHCLRDAYLDTPQAETLNLEGVEVLTNRKLKKLLPGLVEARANKLSATLFQKPDAIVESEPEIYLGRVRRSPAPNDQSANPLKRGWLGGILEAPFGGILSNFVGRSDVERWTPTDDDGPEPSPKTTSDMPTLRSHGNVLIAEALGVTGASASRQQANPELRGAIAIAAQLAAVDHFETHCGLGVRGADVVDVLGLGCVAEIVNPGTAAEDRLVRVRPSPQAESTPFSRTVLLRFDGGDCAAIPALEGYIATVVVNRDGGGNGPTDGIVQVAYTPSKNDYRFGEFQANREQIESLRALVAGLARKGVLHLGKDVAPAFADKARVFKGIDPTLGIYAAYAYNDAGLVDNIRSVEGFMRATLEGAMVYDIALLLREAKTKVYQTLYPCCPMLSQGWALLRVLGGDLPAAVRDASQHRRASLWTTFTPTGADIVFSAARSGDLK
jgi:hypothetical protein